MSSKPETVFREKVVRYLKKLPNTHVFSIQQTTIVGTPDLIICCRGLFLALELKSEKGAPTEIQLYQLRKIKEAGGLGRIVYPRDFDNLKIILWELAHGKRYTMEET